MGCPSTVSDCKRPFCGSNRSTAFWNTASETPAQWVANQAAITLYTMYDPRALRVKIDAFARFRFFNRKRDFVSEHYALGGEIQIRAAESTVRHEYVPS